MFAAAAAAFGAMLFRELALAAVIAGLTATLLDRETRKDRSWLPWALALVASGVALALHVAQVADVVAALPADAANTGAGIASAGLWFHPDGRQLYSSVWTVMWVWGLPWQLGAVLVALSVAGVALVLGRPRADRLLLAAVAIGGIAVLALLRPPGQIREGFVPYYWSGVVMPTVLACIPLAAGRLPGVGGTDTATAEAVVGSPVAQASGTAIASPDAPTAAHAAVDRAPEDAQED